jgi:diacylglycerol kinase family enzyme
MKAPLLVIVNNAAARAHRAWQIAREALEHSGVEFDTNWMGAGIENAGSPEATANRVREGLRTGHSTIAVVGGDGTLSAVASGFFEQTNEANIDLPPRAINSGASLAIIPSGTGDDFARGITGGHREPVEKWIEKLVRYCRNENDRQTSQSDLIWASVDGGKRRFVSLNASSLGIGAEVTGRVSSQKESLRRLPGEARFVLAAVKGIVTWRNRRARVRIDDNDWEECRTNLIAVCNGAFAGGGMNFAPSAVIDDGLLDVITATELSRVGVMREMARIHRGGHIANPKVRVQRCRRVNVESLDDELMIEADGDARGRTPASYIVMPGAIRLVV